MQKKLALGFFALMCIFAFGFALGHSAPSQERPLGIEAHLWIPVTENLGLALRSGNQLGGQTALLGTFWVRQGQDWQPVHIDIDSRVPQVRPLK
jgi:hypothetical protein